MLSEEDRRVWERIGTAAACDAMELLDMPRAVIHGLRSVLPGAVIAGTACTVRQIPKHGGSGRRERLVRHSDVSGNIAKPGEIVVMDTGDYLDCASWGESHSQRCLSRGVVGLVSNGCVRDVSRIRGMAFPAFCAAYSPVKSQWDLETAAVNEPIRINRVQIRPGDLVIADEDGVIVIPVEQAAKVRAKAIEVIEDEGR